MIERKMVYVTYVEGVFHLFSITVLHEALTRKRM